MRNYAGTCKGICSYNLVYNFLIQLLPLKNSVFVVHFSNAFSYGEEAFPKVSSQNEIVPLHIVKICFYLCCYQNQNFSLVLHSCRWCSARVARVLLVLLVSHSCRIRAALVALMSLVSGPRVVNQTRSIMYYNFSFFTEKCF